MKVRQLIEEDIKKLLELIISDKKEQGRTITLEQEESICYQLTTLLKQKNPLTLVAVVNSNILGFINGHIIPFPLIMGQECYISCLLVSSESRGLGVGKKLIKEIEVLSRDLGCSRINLNNPKDAESYKRSFYNKEGYSERDHFANFVKIL